MKMMRYNTGISGLDELVEGGFPFPSTLLLAGGTGCGKTIFSLQFLFAGAKNNEKCLFFTTFSEPVHWMMNFSQRFTFIDKSWFGERVEYVDLGPSLEENKSADDILKLINDKVEETLPQRIVIDPISVLKDMLGSEYRQFLYRLSTMMKNWNAITLLTGEIEPNEPFPVSEAYTMDGVMILSYYGEAEDARCLEVLKMRGTDHMKGKFTYTISDEGITIIPKLLPLKEMPKSLLEEKVHTGVGGLDTLMEGGLPRGHAVLLAGSIGTGKTLLGMQFIHAGITQHDEPGLIVSLEEPREQLVREAMNLNWDFKKHIEDGKLSIIYVPPMTLKADETAFQIKNEIERIGAKRVLIDTISDFEIAFPETWRLRSYVHALVNFFKANGITSILTSEISTLFGPFSISKSEVSLITDVVVVMRYVEIGSRIRKALSILKFRGGDHNKDIREYEISENGIILKEPFKEHENILSGAPRKVVTEDVGTVLSAKLGGPIGDSIFEEACNNIGKTPQTVTQEDIPTLAEEVEKIVTKVLGPVIAANMRHEVEKMKVSR